MAHDENDIQISTGVLFPTEAYTSYFMCSSCGNHILARGNRLHKEEGLGAIICEKVVNVKVGKNVRRVSLLGGCEVEAVEAASVFCGQCKAKLGKLCIAVSEPTEVLQDGRFILFLWKMSYWNGSHIVKFVRKRSLAKEITEGKPVKVNLQDYEEVEEERN